MIFSDNTATLEEEAREASIKNGGDFRYEKEMAILLLGIIVAVE